MKHLMILLATGLMTIPSVAQEPGRYKEIVPDTATVEYVSAGIGSTYIFDGDMRKNVVYVNEQVTTHVIMPEGIKLVDISTASIIGNQVADNIVRIKPAGKMQDKQLAGTMTVIGERHIAQFNVVYVKAPAKANSLYTISMNETRRYNNPDVVMSEGEIARYAWAIYGLPQHFHNIHYKKYGIRAVVNNIFALGDYFFIDFSLYNNTNIKYELNEIRVKLSDKKETKAMNSQTIELTPVFNLNKARSFAKGYRNVLVLDKLTFPNEKILTIEISENQISGRVLYLPIDYSDILNADGFNEELMKSLYNTTK